VVARLDLKEVVLNPLRFDALCRTIAFVAVLGVLSPIGSWADDSEPWGYHGWTPSLGLSVGMLTGKVDGSVRSVDSTGTEIRTPASGGEFVTTPIAIVSLGLDSPALKSVPLRPSLFFRASVIPTFEVERNVASEGAVEDFKPPDALTFTAPAITGQGSQTEVSTNLLAYSLSAGVSIPFEIAGHRFRVRPGVSWMRFAYDLRGDLHHAVKPIAFGTAFRAVDIHRNGKLYQNGVGPYLELESLAGALELTRSIVVGFFAEAAVYRVLGDRRANLGLISSYDDAFGSDTYTTRWSVETDEWFYRFGAGVRIYLGSRIGERDGSS
jgi:hypothetical protein